MYRYPVGIGLLAPWAWESQVRIGTRVVKLKKAIKGALIVGYQGSMSDARELENTPTTEGRQYLHSPNSLQKLWDKIGEITRSS